MKKEFCIMPDMPPIWRNHRDNGLHRHEIFFGTAYRKKSIEDGLVIFLTPELHNMSDRGIHFNHEFDLVAKRAAQRVWMEYYNKTVDEFRQRYGKSWL